MIKYHCDRCKEPIENSSVSTEVVVRIGIRAGKEFDLCSNCTEIILNEITLNKVI